MPSKPPLEIRCLYCALRPLLAVGGRDENGNGFIHIKSWKGKRLYTEVILTSGTMYVRCRNCNRWHRLSIRTTSTSGVIEHVESPLPEEINV